jgi:hypothetical protein
MSILSAPQTPGARQFPARHIPWAFTDLVAAAVRCLPSETPDPEAPALLVEAVRRAGLEVGPHWPGPARALLQECRTILDHVVPVLPRGVIGRAAEARWPGSCVGSCVDGRAFQGRHAWQTRRDIGTLEADADRSETEEPA